MKSNILIPIAEVLIIPIGMFLGLMLFAFTLGWNPLTLLLFWFILIPILVNYLPVLIFKKPIRFRQSIIGVLLFYAFMVFMIYDHIESDFFILMVISLILNFGIVVFIGLTRK